MEGAVLASTYQTTVRAEFEFGTGMASDNVGYQAVDAVGHFHGLPTQPDERLQSCLRTGSNPNDIIVDWPTAGGISASLAIHLCERGDAISIIRIPP